MKLSNALAPDRIELNLSSTVRNEVIKEMIALMNRSMTLSDPDVLFRRILDQEAIKTSGVDRGVAIPHARSDDIDGVVVALGISRPGLDFQSLDGQPVHLIFLILSSEAAMPAYMSVLSRTARIFHRPEMAQKVLDASSPDEIIALIRDQEPI